jgi:hypothetical protein
VEINTFSTICGLLLSYGEKMNCYWWRHAVCFEVHNNACVTPASLLIQQKPIAGILDVFKNLYGCYRSELSRNFHTLYEPVSWLKLNKRWKAGIQGEVKKLAIRRMFYLPVNYPTGSLCVHKCFVRTRGQRHHGLNFLLRSLQTTCSHVLQNKKWWWRVKNLVLVVKIFEGFSTIWLTQTVGRW